MNDYSFTIRFAAEDDMDAWRVGQQIREILEGRIEDKVKVERALAISGPTAMMFTRYEAIQLRRPK